MLHLPELLLLRTTEKKNTVVVENTRAKLNARELLLLLLWLTPKTRRVHRTTEHTPLSKLTLVINLSARLPLSVSIVLRHGEVNQRRPKLALGFSLHREVLG